MRSITWDQGTEMARHLATSDKLGAAVYFCDSRSPWQRGSNENTNGLLRDYFPKGVTLIDHSPQHLLAVENELNRRPRMVLQDRCPADLFAALLASSGPSVLRRCLEPTPARLAWFSTGVNINNRTRRRAGDPRPRPGTGGPSRRGPRHSAILCSSR